MSKAIKWQLGKVSWFNSSSGKGVIKGEDGKSYPIQFSAIDSGKKGKPLKQNQKVKMQVLDDKSHRHVRKLIY